jgi:hypothetical protein
MKIPFIVLLLALAAQVGCAVGNPAASDSTLRRNKPAYYFTFGMGAMISRPNVNFTTSSVHGVRFGRASIGAGIGFDAYDGWKTVPLFGSASWDLFGKNNKVFIQLNYGFGAAWIKKEARPFGYAKSQGGKMINPSLGYRMQSGNLRIHFSMGYKFQRVFSTYDNYYPYPTFDSFMPYPANTTEIRMDMNRWVIGMAVGWR